MLYSESIRWFCLLKFWYLGKNHLYLPKKYSQNNIYYNNYLAVKSIVEKVVVNLRKLLAKKIYTKILYTY